MEKNKIINGCLNVLLGIVIGVAIGLITIFVCDHFSNNTTYIYFIEEVASEPRVVELKTLECTDQLDVAYQNMQNEMKEIEYIEDNKEWFMAYQNIVDRYSLWIDPPETIYDRFTEYEINIICRAVETECYGLDFDSKCNVASVIFNRIEQGGEFGNSVEEVVTKANQFAYDRENISESTLLSIMYAFEIEDTTNGCIAFRSDISPATWYGWEYMFTDDAGHHFYK